MHFNHTAPVLNTDIKRGNYFFRKKTALFRTNQRDFFWFLLHYDFHTPAETTIF
jgi:hypothetical protein